MIYKRWQGLIAPLLFLFAAILSFPTHAQTRTKDKSGKSSGTAPEAKWIESKVVVRVDSPYMSDSGNVVLAYTLTNKTGQDIKLSFSDNPLMELDQPEPIRVFLKLKNPENYAQVKPKDHFLYFSDTLLVADLPVSFHIALSASPEDKPSWFSSEKPEDRLWSLLQKKLGNTESIAIFVPGRKIKLTLPIPTRPSR